MRKDRIRWGQYVLEIVSGDAGVQCRCANGYVEQGDILVGADGAHSAVRQNLYKNLRERGLLPKCDMEGLRVTQNSIIGLTRPVDLKRFPDAGAELAEVHIISGREGSPYTVRSYLLSTPTKSPSAVLGPFIQMGLTICSSSFFFISRSYGFHQHPETESIGAWQDHCSPTTRQRIASCCPTLDQRK